MEIAARLNLLRHNIFIVTTRFGETANPNSTLNLPKDIALIELPFIKLPYLELLLPLPVYLQKLHRLIKDTDIVYFNNIFPFQELMILAIKLIYRKQVINMYQAPLYASTRLRKFYQRAISRFIVRFFNAHHVLNDADRKILMSWQATNICYIPNGVATDKFISSETSGYTKFKILFVGRLNYHKGFDILLNIIKIINHDRSLASDIEFSIIGNGIFELEAKNLMKHHQNIKYLGQIDHEELPGFYASSSILIMPSRYEGMPLVGLEAQSCGVPLIASDIPGMQEIAFNNKSVVLVKTEDADAFAGAICEYHNIWKNQRVPYEKLRKTARDNACNMYSWDKVTNLVLDLLRSV